MENTSMTALISAFSRAYHSINNVTKIFDDNIAKELISENEYRQICQNMTKGINFFNPDFKGTHEQALRWIVDNQLSPSPLGRAAFCEKSLETSVQTGTTQYLILGAGLDTFAYRQPQWSSKFTIFEVDHPLTANDKQMRLKNADIKTPANVHYIQADFNNTDWYKKLCENINFDGTKKTFCNLSGVSYYLTQQAFINILNSLKTILCKGSTIVFDYPDENSFTEKAGKRAKKQALLAKEAKENMLSGYSYSTLEKILSDNNFLIYENLTPEQITEQYFNEYNKANPQNKITAFDNVNYCLAVIK